MTKVKQKPAPSKRGKRAHRGSPVSGTYVYCIVESENLEAILGAAPNGLVSDSGLEPVVSGGFAAVVSTVPLSEYGQPALDTNLGDLNWAASKAMCHERVVEYFASRRAAIPLRFGTIYIDRRSIARMLEERATDFQTVISRLRGKEEWGVYIYCDRAKLIENRVSKTPAVRRLLDQAESASPGKSYLLSKQIERVKADSARDEIARAVHRIEEALDDASERSTSVPLVERRSTEQGELVAKLSFLVETERFEHFRASAEKLAGDHLSLGFHIEIAGPLPPYNFVVETTAQASVR
jgi:hypothetical protein